MHCGTYTTHTHTTKVQIKIKEFKKNEKEIGKSEIPRKETKNIFRQTAKTDWITVNFGMLI